MSRSPIVGKYGAAGHRNLPLMLLQARDILLQQFRPVFNQFGLTEQQWRILRLVSDAGPIEQREIAALCQFSGPNLSVIVARLEEAGYVRRDRSDGDHRRVFVRLDKRGRALVAEVSPHIDRCYKELDRKVGRDLVTSLGEVLDRLLSLKTGDDRDGSET